jgi:hypothetical protein
MNEDEILTAQSTALSPALRAQVHELKTLPQYWDAIASGAKTFEVRRDDRGFQRGDFLRLLKMRKRQLGSYEVEYDTKGEPRYTLVRRITYVLTGGQFGIEPGYVVLGLGFKLDEPRGLSAADEPCSEGVKPNPPEVS